jgi:two-component system OmpR family response regulator
MQEKLSKKILVVEDEAPLRNAISSILNFNGFEVLQAVNGKEGFDLAMKERPDLILLDHMMPVMDGLTMFEKLRQEPDWDKEVMVIFLTNSTDLAKIASPTEEALPDFLIKSDWNIEDIVKKIKERLGIVLEVVHTQVSQG